MLLTRDEVRSMYAAINRIEKTLNEINYLRPKLVQEIQMLREMYKTGK